MVARVTVTLPEPILDGLDSVAHDKGVTRSDIVREAAVAYLSQRERDLVSRTRREAVEDGLTWLESQARCVPASTSSSLELLREVRTEAGGAGSAAAGRS
jgi:Arc/MetJ-type ribon-helix-helix transcriptional regulator